MQADIARHVDAIAHSVLALKDLCEDPSVVAFEDVRGSFEKLEAVLKTKAVLDAFFAFVAERDDAGRVVGSKWAKTYLEKRLGIESRDAYDRLARGKAYFGEPDVEQPDDSESDGASADAECGFDFTDASSTPEPDPEEEERLRREARQRQERARKAAASVSEEKQRVIRIELDKLVDAASSARMRLLADAMAEAPNRSVKDLRALVRRWVARENRKHVDPAHPNAGMEKRSASFSEQKADGTVDISITAAAGHAALLKAIADQGLAPNANLPLGEEDSRSPGQRRYDQLIAALTHYEACQRPAGGGCASLVVACTLDQLAAGDAAVRFPTNVGIGVDCFDLVRLGMDGTTDFILTVDGAEWVPLDLFRTRRTASLGQRVVMMAVQGVCAWAGCTAPLSECEAHHVVSWLKGGNTNIANLAGLCRQHHRMNNDHKDHRGNTSHIDICPDTGRAGLKEPHTPHLKFNTTDAATHSAVNQLRRTTGRRPHQSHQPQPPPTPPPTPPPRTQTRVEPPPENPNQDPYPPF